MKNIRAAAIVLFLSASVSLFAQKNFYRDAEKAFNSHEYFTAIELYKKALSKAGKAKKAEILFKTAECYRMINDMKQAETYYGKAIKAKYSDPIAILYYADAKKIQEKYAEAIAEYNNYKKEVPSDKRGEDGAKSCELAQKWKDNPTRHKVENVQQINTKDWDYAPAYADKKYTTLYISSTRDGATGGVTDGGVGQLFADIFETKVDKNGKWSAPAPLPAPLNSKFNEAACLMNKKQNTMYFTRCGNEKNKHVKCQIYRVAKKGNNWDEPQLLPFNIDTSNFGHPAVDKDETIMIFASDMQGGFGGLDLWISKFDKKAKEWGTPVNLGPTINTQGDELYPSIHENGALYFSSNGHLGMGGLDLFKADNKGDAKYDNVTNLKYPLNSAGDDFAIIFEGKREDKGYFTSNRIGGKGGDDIYSFSLPPVLFTLSGVCVEKESRKPIENATVTLIGSDGTKFELKTDKTGFYKYDINGNARYINAQTSYVVGASGIDIKTQDAPDGYLGNPKGKLTTVGVEKATDFKQDFELLLVKKEIRMPLVLFNLDKYDLLHPSNPKDSLEFLYKVLVENPTITVELGAHTDYRSAADYNQKLSFNRAKTCVEYIISKGVAGDRITAKGYGESKPKTLDTTITLPSGKTVPKGTVLTEQVCNKYKADKKDFEYIMQINRRVVFSILRKDYKPKDGGVNENPFPEIQLNDSDSEGGDEDGDSNIGDTKNEKKGEVPNTPPKDTPPNNTTTPNKPKMQ
ncbi:MAG: OmpA family protein [Bacteroidia bacterium]|nr:OmpA family protein [Bacteroidia bacterium]